DSSLIEAASLMEKHDITRLPVVENEKLVGIISKSDLVRAIIEG
ncbi:MAG: CBS domain-containing protein, partial [Candidatus Aenigmarchaeota archaeon]|nr:CBS domain-containing protein [Candidatus Aenigmarchaeota archaeon]